VTEADIRSALHRLPTDEPPYEVPVDEIVARGRRARRWRRLVPLAAAATIAAAAVAVAALLLPGDDAVTRLTPPADGGRATASGPPSSSSSPPPSPERTWTGLLGTKYYYPPPANGVLNAMVGGVRQVSPRGYAFDFQGDQLQGTWDLDGNVNGAGGPGRLFVTVVRTGAEVQAHACQDPEFKAGGGCTEQALADGALLVRRGLVDQQGYRTVIVLLRRADGVTVTAEAGNYAIGLPGPATLPPQPTPLPITRHLPVYTLDQLETVVRSVDRAVRDCLSRGCES
jgi:hypothetical protein